MSVWNQKLSGFRTPRYCPVSRHLMVLSVQKPNNQARPFYIKYFFQKWSRLALEFSFWMLIIQPRQQNCIQILNVRFADVNCKLMQLGSPNQIDVVKSNLKSEFDRRLKSLRILTILSNRRYRFSIYINIKSIYFRLINLFWYKID